MKRIKKINELCIIKTDTYVTKEVLQAIIEDKVIETYYWLKRAYETTPKNDPVIREQITEISAQLLKMRQDISAAFENPKG